MIITDSSLRPAERFIKVVSEYFIKNGYSFRKSDHSFIKPFEKGFHVISLRFRIGMLTDVTFSWCLHFEKLAKLHALLRGHPKKYKHMMYMPANLAGHTRWEKDFEHTWKLYDEASETYTDISINAAAEKFIKAYEFYVPNYFQYYGKYESLEKDYNHDEFKSIAGLILARYFDRPQFESLLQTYSTQVKLREPGEQSEEHLTLNRFIEYIANTDIKKVL